MEESIKFKDIEEEILSALKKKIGLIPEMRIEDGFILSHDIDRLNKLLALYQQTKNLLENNDDTNNSEHS